MLIKPAATTAKTPYQLDLPFNERRQPVEIEDGLTVSETTVRGPFADDLLEAVSHDDKRPGKRCLNG